MSRKFYTLLCLFVFYTHFCVNPLQAEPRSEVLDLREALEMAYQQNPRVIQARKAVEGAQGDLITARTWANPQIEAEIGGLKSGGDNSNLEEISIKQPFDPIGVRYLKKKIGRNEVKIQEQALKGVWSDVYVEVRSVYAKLILNQKELELKRNNLKTMRQFFSDVQLRYQSGQALKNHVQRARIELLKAESDYLTIENDLEIDKARLNLLMGRKRDVLFDVKNELEEEQLVLNLEELIDIALKKRPELKIAETLLDSRRENVRKENLSRLPSYALGLKRTDEDSVEDYAAIVEISIPLWNFNNGEVKRSKAERDAQAILVEAKKEEIAFEVYAAYKDAHLAMKQLELYKQSLAEANEMFRLAGLRYGEGHIDFLNYLDQLQASLDSRLQYYQGLYRLNQNINHLEKAIYSSLREEAFLR